MKIQKKTQQKYKKKIELRCYYWAWAAVMQVCDGARQIKAILLCHAILTIIIIMITVMLSEMTKIKMIICCCSRQIKAIVAELLLSSDYHHLHHNDHRHDDQDEQDDQDDVVLCSRCRHQAIRVHRAGSNAGNEV